MLCEILCYFGFQDPRFFIRWSILKQFLKELRKTMEHKTLDKIQENAKMCKGEMVVVVHVVHFAGLPPFLETPIFTIK